MATKTKNERKNKKTLIALLLLLIAFAIIIGLAVSYFSDYVSTSLNATAGTLDIEATGATASQRYTKGGTAVMDPITNLGSGISNLNPGDVIEIIVPVVNSGTKSAYLREKLTITPTLSANGKKDASGTAYAAPTIDQFAGVIKVYSATELVSDDDIAKMRAGDTTGFDNPTIKQVSVAAKTTTVESTPATTGFPVISGSAEADGDGTSLRMYYYVVFSTTATDMFQGQKMSIEVKTEALQYRNNDGTNWGTIEKITI